MAKLKAIIKDECDNYIISDLNDLVDCVGDNGFEMLKVKKVNTEIVNPNEYFNSYISIGNIKTKEITGLWFNKDDEESLDRLFYKLNNWFGVKCIYRSKVELEEITTIEGLYEACDKIYDEYFKNDSEVDSLEPYFNTSFSDEKGFTIVKRWKNYLSSFSIDEVKEYGYEINIK